MGGVRKSHMLGLPSRNAILRPSVRWQGFSKERVGTNMSLMEYPFSTSHLLFSYPAVLQRSSESHIWSPDHTPFICTTTCEKILLLRIARLTSGQHKVSYISTAGQARTKHFSVSSRLPFGHFTHEALTD